MSRPDYLYVIAIAKPPEEVWEALTSPEFTRQYWHKTEVQSDFARGSAIRFMLDDEVGCEGEILAAEYPTELSYTWQFPNNPQTKDEEPSRVTFRLERIPTGTKLVLVHDRFPPASKMLELVSGGWPLVLGGLKTLVETGVAIDFSAAV